MLGFVKVFFGPDALDVPREGMPSQTEKRRDQIARAEKGSQAMSSWATLALTIGSILIATVVTEFAWWQRVNVGMFIAKGIAVIESTVGVAAICWGIAALLTGYGILAGVLLIWGLFATSNGGTKLMFERRLYDPHR